MQRFNPNHLPSGPGGGQFAPAGGGGGAGGSGATGISGKVSAAIADTKAFVKGKSAKEVIAAVASNHKVKENAKEALSVSIQGLINHVTGLDQSTWQLNEELIGHTVHHFADIAQITALQAKNTLQTAIHALIALRKRKSRAVDDEQDDVVDLLEALAKALDKVDTKDPEPKKPEEKPARSGEPTHYRTTVSVGNGLDFVISDGSLDRHGTRINPEGWQLSSFKKNPIALFGHSQSFPIGVWSDVRVVSGQLRGTLNFAAPGTSERIDELRKLAEQGILRSVSVGFSILEEGKPGTQFDIERQELLEASLVSVGSNKNALALARSLNVSDETISLAFGEQAVTRRGGVSTNGEHAATKTADAKSARAALPSRLKAKPMKTLAQRIEDAQNDLVAKRDTLVELSAADELDNDAIDALNDQLEAIERNIASLKRSEAKIGLAASGASDVVEAPAVNRRPLGFPQKEVGGFDLLVRKAVAFGISRFGDKPIEKVLDERYPGHEATHMYTRADQTVGTTSVSGWASQIVQTVNQGFLQALLPYSFYPQLRARGQGFSFDGIGTVSLPSRTAGGAGGGFVAEGSPIRVGRITTAATTLTPFKLGVIVPFTRELAKRSTPAIEALVRQAILEDTAAILDAAIIDTNAASSSRPAGLLNGLSAVASGYGGGDYLAVVSDIKALVAPFTSANAADNIVILMNPAQGLALSMMPGPGPAGEFGWATPLTNRYTIIESTTVPANRLIALRASDFATAMGDVPDFDVSEQATVHMEDTTPLEIVSGTGPTTADPVRSFFQTATIGVRMLMDVTWKMRRTGMVQWIDTTTW